MSVDTGVRDSEFVVPEGVVGSIQVVDLQTNQKAKGSLAPAGGDTMMGDILGVVALDLDSRLSIFLARSDLMEFNRLPASQLLAFLRACGRSAVARKFAQESWKLYQRF